MTISSIEPLISTPSLEGQSSIDVPSSALVVDSKHTSASDIPIRYRWGSTTPEAIAHTKTNKLPLVDTRNRWRISSLFFETYNQVMADPDVYRPLWTLRQRDLSISPASIWWGKIDTLPSIYKLYMECNDPYEYDFAQRAFGSYEHWQAILKNEKILEFVESWRMELRTKIESEALRAARRMAATEDGSVGLQALKWVHNALQPKNTKGRPSKDEVKKQAKKMAEEAKDSKEDMSRIGLSPEEMAILKEYEDSTDV